MSPTGSKINSFNILVYINDPTEFEINPFRRFICLRDFNHVYMERQTETKIDRTHLPSHVNQHIEFQMDSPNVFSVIALDSFMTFTYATYRQTDSYQNQ